jgi:glutaryl-CoA dehydrogenase
MDIAETSDFYDIASMLTDDERAIQKRVRDFADSAVIPIINEHWEAATMPTSLYDGLRDLGIVGGTIQGYGCPGMSRTAAGIVAQELSRGDGSVNTINAVQTGLVMGSIDRFGSSEQKERWLPRLARMDALGAFALTEPDHGSDSVGLETSARRDGDEWIIDGHKRWIGLGSVADIVIIWARDVADGKVKGFVMERIDGAYPEGYRPTVIEGKMAKRAVWQADIVIEGLRLREADRLPGAGSFRDVSALLSSTRTTVAWEAVGHAIAAFEIARDYARDRRQFGKPIGSYQLVQNKLANMLADLTSLRLLVLRASRLQDEGRLSNEQASLAKLTAGQRAREICREARDMLGGNGLLLENHVARHLLDMEVVHTYEGTDSIQSLIVGRAITGIAAFA